MTKYSVRGPDGHTYSIEGPEGASDEEVIAEIQRQNPQIGGGQKPAPATETVVENGLPSQSNDFLGDEGRQKIGEMFSRRAPTKELNDFILGEAQKSGVIASPYSEEVIKDYYGKLDKAGPEAQATAPGYSIMTPEQLGVTPSVQAKEGNPQSIPGLAVDTGVLNDIVRGYQEATQYGTPGFLAREYYDLTDYGKDELRKRFPNATDDQIEALADNLINLTQKQLRETNAGETANDNTVAHFAGMLPGSAGPEDLIPGGEVAGIAQRTARAAVQNAAADAAYQGLDIHQGVQDEYNPEQTVAAGALGGGLHLGVEGVHALASTKAPASSERVNVPDATDATVRYNSRVEQYLKSSGKKPTAKLRRKAAAQAVADHINDVTEGWKNAPEFEVHESFDKLDGVDNDALGMIDDSGKVIVNLKAVTDEAKARGVSPTDVTTAMTYHEALGHHGMSQLFGEGLDDVLHTMYDGSTSFKNKVDRWLKDNPDAYVDHPDRTARAADEVLAEMSEKGQLPVSIINRFKNLVKDTARKMGIKWEYTNREIETILGMAHSAAVKGAPSVRENGFLGSRYKNSEGQMSPEREKAFHEYVLANNERPSKLFNELENGLNPEAEAVIAAREAQLKGRPTPVPMDDSKPTGGYAQAKSAELIDRAEANPGKVQTSLMWPHRQDIVDFRYVDPETREEIYGAFRRNGATAEGFEIYGAGRNEAGLKTIQTIRRQIKEQFPELTKIEATRISGARKGGATVPVGEGDEISVNLSRYKKRSVQEERRKRQEQEFLSSRGAQTPAERTVLRAEGIVRSDSEEIIDRGIEQLHDVLDNHPLSGLMRGRAVEALHNLNDLRVQKFIEGNSRYMKRKSKEVSNDDIFESENAYDILKAITDDYKPVTMSLDELRHEAEARGLSPERLLKNKDLDLGELPRRFIMQDIAAEKLNDKVTKLYNKIQSGQGTYNDRVAHAQALLKFKQLSARIFDEQGEAGRLLRTIQDLQYTRKKVNAIRDATAEFTEDQLHEILQDPEAYGRFAKGIQDQINEAETAKESGKFGEKLANVLNLPRALMSSVDLSAPFRQGLFLVGRPEFWKSLPGMIKYFASEGSYDNLMADITSRNTYPSMLTANVAFSGRTGKLSAREEAFQSELAHKIPGIGKLVTASERAYNGFLNKLRADTFDSFLADADKAGVDINKKFLESAGNFINHATGRGSLGGVLNSAAPLLNSLFFSPRLIASRAQLLNPQYYVSLDPFVRKQAIRSLLSATGFVATVLGLGAMAGAEVENDPRSSDFGKIKVGNTRYDIPGGFAQYITLGARLATGQQKTALGDVKDYGTKMGQKTRLDALAQFFTNKAAPVPSFILDALRGKDAVGQKFDLSTAVGNRFIPMFAQDYMDVAKEYGWSKGALMAAPGVLGVGIQDYVPKAADPDAEVDAPDSFQMQELEDGENQFVSVKDGTVKLKGEAQKEWQRRLNFYSKEWIKDEMANPEWKKMTLKEKAKVIKAVRDDAKKQTKEDMVPLLGLGGDVDDNEAPSEED